MAFSPNRQIQEAIGRSRQILIVFPPTAGADSVCAALALGAVLKKQGRQADIVSAGFSLPPPLSFLPFAKEIKPALSPVQKFIVKVDVSKNKLDSLSYDVKDGQLYIYITPRTGLLNREDVKTASTDLKFDLIFVLGAADWESLGNVYDNNTELFYRTPTVNIDCRPANEHFGQLNLVDLTAVSVSEILFEFFSQAWPDQINEEIATLLLTGMIANTKSFRTQNVTARALGNAAKLVNLGADREKITHHLFRNRSLATLKLWGRALSHLQYDSAAGLAWLTLSREDFRAAGAGEENLPDIIDELISSSPEAKAALLLYEKELSVNGALVKQIEGVVAVFSPHLDAKLLAKPFSPEGAKNQVKIGFKNKDLLAAEKETVDYLKNSLTIAKK